MVRNSAFGNEPLPVKRTVKKYKVFPKSTKWRLSVFLTVAIFYGVLQLTGSFMLFDPIQDVLVVERSVCQTESQSD